MFGGITHRTKIKGALQSVKQFRLVSESFEFDLLDKSKRNLPWKDEKSNWFYRWKISQLYSWAPSLVQVITFNIFNGLGNLLSIAALTTLFKTEGQTERHKNSEVYIWIIISSKLCEKKEHVTMLFPIPFYSTYPCSISSQWQIHISSSLGQYPDLHVPVDILTLCWK